MPSINLYVHKDLNSPTTKVWENFFQQYLPHWDLRPEFAEEILRGKPQHILFPGGSGSKFSRRLGSEMKDRVRLWVSGGGSYIGVCAGAYLAASHLCITPLVIPDPAWQRGLHDVALDMNSPFDSSQRTVNYHNGPVFEECKEVEVWARFRSNYLAEGGHFSMEGTPAICHNRYGRGTVTVYSPHLEKSSDEAKAELAKSFEYIEKIRSASKA